MVIIDEVDSMLIDENNTIARLADQLPGMEWLNPLFYGIWRAVNADADPLSKRSSLVEKIKSLISGSDPMMRIPTHLQQFALDSMPTWVDHAIRAKIEYRLDHHYMIKPDETRTKRIMPIDFSNTGVIQSCTTWSDGLHQFLQIKHGLKMTALTVTTNYLSNVGLFTRYNDQIYGLTGTIGSKDAQDLLYKIYKVDTMIIPPFKQKRHIPLQPILTMTDDDWLTTVVSDTLSNVRKRRAILVICETRVDAKTIAKQLQRADPTCLIRMYTDNTDAVESNAVGGRIQSGEIIVATNLAGRGTDLKTSPEVEKQGGLHVCLTFLPGNLRVEEQAFGRTSRQGNRGTSQMILSRDRTLRQLLSSYSNYSVDLTVDPIPIIRDWRSKAERAHLDRIWAEEITEIQLKDELFKQFCELLSQLRKKNDDVYRLLSVKEQWGLWLKSMDYAIQNRLSLKGLLEQEGYDYIDTPRDGLSFFHAISHQIDGQLTAQQIKDQVIQHLIDNKEHYKEMNDEQRHLATSRTLNMSIAMFRSDSCSWSIYEQEDSVHECFIGYIVDTHYVSLKPLNPSDKSSTNVQNKTNDEQKKSRFQQLFSQMKKLTDLVQQQKKSLEKELLTKVIDLDLKQGFKKFAEQTDQDYSKDEIIRNPCYLMLDAETIIGKLATWSNSIRSFVDRLPFADKKAVTFEQAIERLERAARIDPIFAFSALVNHAYCLIHQKSPPTYKITAKSYLVRAQEQIGRYILPQLHSMQLEMNDASDEFVYEDLVKQIQMKLEILQLYQSHITQAITTIEASQKLVDVTAISDTQVTIGEKLYRNDVEKFIKAQSGTIELTFHNLSVYHDAVKRDQALQLLNKLSKDDERVSIHFLEANTDIVKNVLETGKTRSTVCLNIQYLDTDEVPKLIVKNKADLTLTTSKECYLQVIQEMKTDVTVVMEASRWRLSAVDAVGYVEREYEKIKSILFESITQQRFDMISKVVKEPVFGLTFPSLSIARMQEMVNGISKPFSFEFRDLTVAEARKLIDKTTERNFVLTVHNLTSKRAREIFKKFDRNEQDIAASMQRLLEHFSKNDQSYEELNTFNVLGVSLLITIDELNPRPWISVGIVVALGVGQIVGGVCLAALTCGLGVSLGISLIGEGVNDILFGIRGAISRRFSWKDYAIQKGVSLTICFVTLGFSAVGQAAKAAQAAGKTGTMSIVGATAQGTVNIVKTSFSTVGSGAIKGIASSSWKLACTQVAVTCAETGVREVANYTSDAVFNEVLSSVKSSIHDEIDRIAKVEYAKEEYSRIFNRALMMDTYNTKDTWQGNIEQVAMKILTKQKNEVVEVLKSLSKGITNAFLNHARQYKGRYSQVLNIGHQILTVLPQLSGSYELATVTEKFFTAYRTELLIMEQKIPTLEDLLIQVSDPPLSSDEAVQIRQLLIDNRVLTVNGDLNIRFTHEEEQNDIRKIMTAASKASDTSARSSKELLIREINKIQFTSETHRNYVEIVLGKLSSSRTSLRIAQSEKKIVKMLVEQVCMIIHGSFITPMTNYVISTSIASLSTNIQLAFDPNGTVTEKLMEAGAQRYINVVANDWFRKVERGEIQIDSKAKEKIENLAKQYENEDGKPKNYTEELALGIINGKQGDTLTLSVLAMLSKTPVSVIQEQLGDQSGQDDGSTRLVYTPPKVDETTGQVVAGHYEVAGDAPVTGGPNDCLYAAFLKKFPNQFKSIDDVRAQCAAFILSNPSFVEGVFPAVDIINQSRNPLRKEELMGQGGAIKVSFKNEDAKDLKTAKNQVMKDMENFLDKQGHQQASSESKKFMKSTLTDGDYNVANFDQASNYDNQVVQIDYDFKITHDKKPDFKVHCSINADQANEKLKQPDHIGCDMYSTTDKKTATHKWLPKETLQSRRPVDRKDPQPKMIVTTGSKKLPTGETVEWKKTVWKYPTNKKDL